MTKTDATLKLNDLLRNAIAVDGVIAVTPNLIYREDDGFRLRTTQRGKKPFWVGLSEEQAADAMMYGLAKNPHAVALGRKGGKANAGIPKPASAENGKKGGRPKGSKNKPKD